MKTPYTVVYKLQTFKVQDPGDEAGHTYRNGAPMRSSEDVFRIAKGIYSELDVDCEHFIVFALNNKNRFIGFKVVSTGSLTASIVHPAKVYRAALFLDAAAVVFTHNHPSGDPAPSAEDIEITRRLKQCGEIFGIRVLDHVVLGADRFYSFSDRGNL